MTTGRTAVIIAILIPGITILASSDILKAEFLTSFRVEPRIVHPEQENVIGVANIGLLQADNVVLTLYANGTIDGFRDACPEGTMYQMDDKTLVAEFQRMSPLMVCQFKLSVSEPVHLDIVAITSDHRSTWAPDVLPYSLIFLVSLLVIEVVAFSIVCYLITRYEFRCRVESWWHQYKFTKEGYPHKVCEFIWKEYGLHISKTDAEILEIVHKQKKTMGQLKTYSGLNIQKVKYHIWKLKHLELLKESLELDLSLNEYFRSTLEKEKP